MKKVCLSFLALLILTLSAICIFTPQSQATTEYLRIHIRANSNSQEDQQVKYLIKDAVVEFLTPLVAQCDTKQKAQDMLNQNIQNIEKVSNEVLYKNGFNYKSKACVDRQSFPVRVYDGVTLDSGIYDAIIINLGSGTGDNWWCVVYPPLCFTGESTGYIYKSKIYQIINAFFKRNI